MKRVIITIIVILPLLLNAQSFWNSVYDAYVDFNKKGSLLHLNDSVFILASFNSSSCSSSAIMYYNNNGSQLKTIYGSYYALSTLNNEVYAAGIVEMGDVLMEEQLIIAKFSSSGEELFNVVFPEEPNYDHVAEGALFFPISMDVADGTGIVICSSNKVKTANIDGSYIQTFILNASVSMAQVQIIDSVQYLFRGKQSYYKANEAMVFVDSIDMNEKQLTCMLLKDTIYSLSANYLIRIDTGLQVIDTLLIANEWLFSTMDFSYSQLWIQSLLEDRSAIIQMKNNAALDTVMYKRFVTDKDFVMLKDRAVFAGYNYADHLTAYSYLQDKPNDTAYFPDIALYDFNIFNIELIYYDIGDLPKDYSFEASFTVQNNGADTIHSFTVYSPLRDGFMCERYYAKKFTDVTILPGDTLTVYSSRIIQGGLSGNWTFELFAPNAELEFDVLDNSLSKSFTIVGVDDVEIQNELKVFPNPVKKTLNFNFELEETYDVQICTLLGKVVFSKTKCEDNVLDISNLKPGVYLLNINTNNELKTLRFVKE